MEKIKGCVPCLFGLEGPVADELKKIGAKNVTADNGRVYFEGAPAIFVDANLWLRCGQRVEIVLGSFPAKTFEELFEGVRKLPWERFIPEDGRFPVKGHALNSKLSSVPACQSIVKKAIVRRLEGHYKRSLFPESGMLFSIRFSLLKDQAVLMLDTTGNALHKRGYRPTSSFAPLRETLAAALVKTARPREDVLFWDPMCGSGTIAIEAAMMMNNIAPGLERGFAAMKYDFVPHDIWKKAREEANDLRLDTAFEAYASDIDPECVEITKENCKRAGVVKWVKAFERNALEIRTGGRRGTIVCNPPYGERILTMQEAEKLYRDMGKHFKTLDNWQIYVITSHERFEKLYGRRADKVRKLYNGMIPCYYYQFFRKDIKK